MEEPVEEPHRWEWKGTIKEPVHRGWRKEWRTLYISHCAHCGVTKYSPPVVVDYSSEAAPVPPPAYREPAQQRRQSNPYPL